MKAEERAARRLLYTVYFIYFFCGMTQCFEGVFLPEFKEYFRLNYEQQMYTMFAKNIPFLLAVPIGMVVRRAGFKNTMTAAMILFGAGTLLLAPGLGSGRYEWVLAGFFLIGTGFNCEMVAGNPMLSALGPASASSSRLNLGNALGAVAQIIAPASLTLLIPATVLSVEGKLPYMKGLFLVLGIALMAIAAATLGIRNPPELASELEASPGPAAAGERLGFLRFPRLTLGFLAIFLVLGVEAGVFGLYRNFLEDPAIAGLTARESQRMFTVYFAVFAAGRLAASWLQRRMSASTHLLMSLAAASACLAVAVTAKGMAAVAALTVLGFFVSILFPTLYSLAIEGMGSWTAQASGLLTMGFVGCAVIPVAQGRLADTIGLQRSFAVSAVAYLFAAFYAWKGRKLEPVPR